MSPTMRYLTMTFITPEVLASNNRTESLENTLALPTILTSRGTVITVSSVAYKYALRSALQAAGNLKLYRTVTDGPYESGLRYGPTFSKIYNAAVMEEEGVRNYDDSIFGYLATQESKTKRTLAGGDESEAAEDEEEPKPKKGKKEKGEPKPKLTHSNAMGLSLIHVSPLIGISNGRINTHFRQGHTVDNENFAPVNVESCSTRFAFTVRLNLKTIHEVKGDRATLILTNILTAIQSGVCPGGNQNNNLAEIRPDLVAYSFHNTPGAGLQLPCTFRWMGDESVDLVHGYYTQRGVDFTMFGIGTPTSLKDGFNELRRLV